MALEWGRERSMKVEEWSLIALQTNWFCCSIWANIQYFNEVHVVHKEVHGEKHLHEVIFDQRKLLRRLRNRCLPFYLKAKWKLIQWTCKWRSHKTTKKELSTHQEQISQSLSKDQLHCQSQLLSLSTQCISWFLLDKECWSTKVKLPEQFPSQFLE